MRIETGLVPLTECDGLLLSDILGEYLEGKSVTPKIERLILIQNALLLYSGGPDFYESAQLHFDKAHSIEI